MNIRKKLISIDLKLKSLGLNDAERAEICGIVGRYLPPLDEVKGSNISLLMKFGDTLFEASKRMLKERLLTIVYPDIEKSLTLLVVQLYKQHGKNTEEADATAKELLAMIKSGIENDQYPPAFYEEASQLAKTLGIQPTDLLKLIFSLRAASSDKISAFTEQWRPTRDYITEEALADVLERWEADPQARQQAEILEKAVDRKSEELAPELEKLGKQYRQENPLTNSTDFIRQGGRIEDYGPYVSTWQSKFRTFLTEHMERLVNKAFPEPQSEPLRVQLRLDLEMFVISPLTTENQLKNLISSIETLTNLAAKDAPREAEAAPAITTTVTSTNEAVPATTATSTNEPTQIRPTSPLSYKHTGDQTLFSRAEKSAQEMRFLKPLKSAVINQQHGILDVFLPKATQQELEALRTFARDLKTVKNQEQHAVILARIDEHMQKLPERQAPKHH